ncbi:hypothetical protein ACHAPU_001303 [Fusarium lateritium]
MDGVSLPAMTTVTDTVRLIRGRSARSKYINDLIMDMKAEREESGTMTLLFEALEYFVGIWNMDIAMTVFNLHRFGFNEQQLPGNSYASLWDGRKLTQTNAWNVMGYYTETLLDWKRLREFLELADNIHQLSTVFSAMPAPEEFWPELLSNINAAAVHAIRYQDEAANGASLHYLHLTRDRMWHAICMNPPGSQPADLDAEEIDEVYLACVQREFWYRELGDRSAKLLLQHHEHRLPENKIALNFLQPWTMIEQCVDTTAFCRLVSKQRLILAADKIGIRSQTDIEKLWTLLGWGKLGVLGVQGLAACLPSKEEGYGMQFLFQLSTTCTQISSFWGNFEAQKNVTWYDGWAEKYPVSGPIDHVTLDIDYSVLEEGEEEGEVCDVPSTVIKATVAKS